jgi:REP element-mobilizing transposase RayT
MRHPRITYKDAFHHVMNRGIKGEKIFESSKDKKYFLELVLEKSKILKIRILAYCVLDNHFHLIIQNCSGKMSEFLKRINSQYGYYYRKNVGGYGYVFQGRYKSTLIQEDEYLKMSLLYLFLNPVRSGIVSNPFEYNWSSIQELYLARRTRKLTDYKFIEGLFGDRVNFVDSLNIWMNKELPIEQNRFGNFLGDNKFLPKSLNLYNRRRKKGISRRMRIFDQYFRGATQIISEFENEKGVTLDKVDFVSIEGKGLRGELLVRLKDEGGLKYTEIINYPWFESLKYNSLGQLYKRTKVKLNNKVKIK